MHLYGQSAGYRSELSDRNAGMDSRPLGRWAPVSGSSSPSRSWPCFRVLRAGRLPANSDGTQIADYYQRREGLAFSSSTPCSALRRRACVVHRKPRASPDGWSRPLEVCRRGYGGGLPPRSSSWRGGDSWRLMIVNTPARSIDPTLCALGGRPSSVTSTLRAGRDGCRNSIIAPAGAASRCGSPG